MERYFTLHGSAFRLKEKTLILIGFICAWFTAHAHASNDVNVNNFNYAGVSFIHSSVQNIAFTAAPDSSSIAPLSFSDDTSDQGFKLLAGRQIYRYLAVEASLSSFTSASFDVFEEINNENGESSTERVASGEFDSTVADIRAIFTYPFGQRFHFKLMAGVTSWQNDFDTVSFNDNAYTIERQSDAGIDSIYGVGLAYGFNRKYAISLDIERSEVANLDVTNVAASLLMKF